MKFNEIIDESFDADAVAHGSRVAAKAWLKTHPDVYAELAHFHNDGDEVGAARVLNRHIKDEELMWAVMNELGFSGDF